MANPETSRDSVTIIDSNEDRRKGMATAFIGNASVQLAYYAGGTEVILRDDSGKLEQLKPTLITLQHFGDPLVDGLESHLTVYYGGNGGNDSRHPSARERIWRPIDGTSGVLTVEEATQLIEYAQALKANREAIRPSFLEPLPSVSLLPALAILCQGYLAVHAACDPQKVNWDANKLRLTLERHTANGSGSYEALRALLLPTTLPAHLRQVRSPLWWRKPFFSLEYGGDALDDFKAQLFLSDVEKEWNNLRGSEDKWEPLKELLMLIETTHGRREPSGNEETKPSGKEEVEPPDKVENAYNVLVEVLKRGS